MALVLLFGVDRYVNAIFVPARIVGRFEPPRVALVDRTSGNNMGILFRLAERRRASNGSLIAMVGDSTIMTGVQPPETSLVAAVRQVASDKLRADAPVDVMEFSSAGMPATDAVLFIAKALGMGVDLVTYSMTPRVLCTPSKRSSDVDRWVMDDDVRRELGWPYLLGSFGPEDLARSFVISHWDLYRFRFEITEELRDRIGSLLASSYRPRRSPYPPRTFGAMNKPGPLWTWERCSFDPSNAQVLALKRIIEMCAESRRCLLYHSPINPAGRSLFEAGLLPQFSRDVIEWTSEESVQFRNYAMLVKASGFAPPPADSVFKADAVHMNARGRWRLAEFLGNDVATLVRRVTRADRPSPSADLHARVHLDGPGVVEN